MNHEERNSGVPETDRIERRKDLVGQHDFRRAGQEGEESDRREMVQERGTEMITPVGGWNQDQTPVIYATPKKPSYWRGVLVLLFIATCMASCTAICINSGKTPTIAYTPEREKTGAEPEVKTKAKPELTWMTSDELQASYHQNEVRADAFLKGKRIGVTGTVDSINKDFVDKPYLLLEGGDNMFMQTHAEFTSDHLSELSDLQKGQDVRMSCRVRGMVLGSVILNDCQFEAESQLKPVEASPETQTTPDPVPPRISEPQPEPTQVVQPETQTQPQPDQGSVSSEVGPVERMDRVSEQAIEKYRGH